MHSSQLLFSGVRARQAAASAALAAGFALLSSTASAHIELQAPLNRYSDIKAGDNKSCPCGSGTTNRSCKKPEELSDPDRSPDRETTFAPGDTITVRFDEYVGHSGRYRIAFDPDGADLDHFNQNILLDEPDPSGNVGNMGQGSMWQFQVTLPNMTCDNCTLQLIQVMDGNTVDPVLNPVDRGGTYFQCADIVLAEGAPPGGLAPASPTDHLGQKGRPVTTPAAAPGMMAATSSGTGSGTMPSGAMPSAAMPSAAMPSSMTATTGSGTNTTVVTPSMDSSADDGGGCSVSGARSSRSWPGALVLGSILFGVGLRTRRSKRR
jgi:hypothetical protein